MMAMDSACCSYMQCTGAVQIELGALAAKRREGRGARLDAADEV